MQDPSHRRRRTVDSELSGVRDTTPTGAAGGTPAGEEMHGFLSPFFEVAVAF